MLIIQWMSDMLGDEQDAEDIQMVAGELLQNKEVYVWEESEPVCMVTTGLRTNAGIFLAQLYTPPEQRHLGYATALLHALSQQLIQQGWLYCAIMLTEEQNRLTTLAENAGFALHGQLTEYYL